MKQLFLTLLLCFTTFISSAQITLSKAEVDSLPPAAKQAIELAMKKQQVEDNLRNASEYASWGREIGYAVDGALSAVEEHVVSLSETELGKTVTFLVVWKLIGRDILGIVIGFCLFVSFLAVLTNLYRTWKSKEWQEWSDGNQTGFVIISVIASIALFVSSLCCAFPI